MKALYSVAMSSFFKTIDAGFKPTFRENQHIQAGEWIEVDIPDYDGNLSHYGYDGGNAILSPESEWPENNMPEETTDGGI